MSIAQDLQDAKKLVENVLSQYIVKSTTSGINGFVFDIMDDEEIFLDSDITDHYVEDNYAVEDHIARKPERFVLRGYVAELRNIFSYGFLSILTNIQSLASIGGFLPEFSFQATQTYSKIADVASKVGNVLNQAQNIYDMFSQKSTTANQQQNAYKYFKDLWFSRILCTVETPFDILTDMAIESVRVLQKGDTKFISDFSITFKKIRTTNTISYNPAVVGNIYKFAMDRFNDMTGESAPQNNGAFAGLADSFEDSLQSKFQPWPL